MEKQKSKAPALERGMRVLEELAQAHQPLTMSQVAHKLKLPASSVQRILEELVLQGFLSKTSTNGYYLTDRLYRMVASSEAEESLLSCAMEEMRRFVHETGESVHLSVARDRHFVVIGQVHGTSSVRISVRQGSYPLMEFPSGWVLLAFTAREAWLPAEPPPDMQERIHLVRKDGYGLKESTARCGIYHLSVPVLDSEEIAVGVLSTSFALPNTPDAGPEYPRQVLLPQLRTAADGIRKKLYPDAAVPKNFP